MVTSGERNSMTGDRMRDSPTFVHSFKYCLIYTYYLFCCKVLQWHMKIQKHICWLNSPISTLPTVSEYLYLLLPPGMWLKWQKRSGAFFQVLLCASDYFSVSLQDRGMEDFQKPPLWDVCSDQGFGFIGEVSVVYLGVSWEKFVLDFLYITISLCNLRNKKLLGSKRCFQCQAFLSSSLKDTFAQLCFVDCLMSLSCKSLLFLFEI